MAIREVSNVQLVQLCAKEPDNSLAWDEFVDRFNRYITLYVIRVLRVKGQRPLRTNRAEPGELVCDLVQEVYLCLLKNRGQALKRFQGQHEKSIYTYLAKIVTTVVLDHLRQASADKRAAQMVSWCELLPKDSNPSEGAPSHFATSSFSYSDYQLNEQVTIEDVRHRLELLLEGEQKERDILIFLLHVFDGLTASDIAAQEGIGLTPHGIESVLRRIKHKLRETIEAERQGQAG